MTSSILLQKFLSNRLKIVLNTFKNNFSKNSEKKKFNNDLISSAKKLFLIGKIIPTNLKNKNFEEKTKNKFLVKNEEENFSFKTAENSNFLNKKRFITFDTNILKKKKSKIHFL